MFQVGRTLNATHNEATSSGMFQLDQSDSFSNLTYILFWEQNYMGNSRRLRSTHVFGEGQMSSYSVLTILPTKAQMGDSTGGITYDETSGGTASSSTPSGASHSSAPSPAAESSTNWGLILGIAGGALVFIGGAYMYTKGTAPYKKFNNVKSNQLKHSELKKAGYKKVNRYERFTTDF